MPDAGEVLRCRYLVGCSEVQEAGLDGILAWSSRGSSYVLRIAASDSSSVHLNFYPRGHSANSGLP